MKDLPHSSLNIKLADPMKYNIKQNPKQDQMMITAILSLFTIFLILVYSLPDDVLLRYPSLRQGVDSIELVVPVVNNLREHSTFPQVAATVYALGVMLWLILTVFFIIYLPFAPINISNTKLQLIRNFFGACIFLAIFGYIFFIYFPGNDFEAVTGRRGRFFSHMLDNRFIFAGVSAVMFSLIALMISSIWTTLKILLRLFFKN